MTLEDILKMWDDDHEINRFDLAEESLKSAKLHAKYLKMYSKVRAKKRTLEEELDITKLVKTQYYLGRGTAEMYKKKPFNINITKSELPEWLKADDEMRNINRQLGVVKEMEEMLKIILNEIGQRDWRIKHAQTQIMFESGA